MAPDIWPAPVDPKTTEPGFNDLLPPIHPRGPRRYQAPPDAFYSDRCEPDIVADIRQAAELLNSSPAFLPPTHSQGPRSLQALTDRLVPKPPNERGWHDDSEPRQRLSRGKPFATWGKDGKLYEIQLPDTAAVDRTFENETRLHR